MKNLWNWGFLDKCFKPGIRVSDIDGFVERKGQFLWLEAKSGGKQIPQGQRIAFAALAKLGCTVLVLWGETNNPQKMQVWYPNENNARDPIDASESDVQDFVARWFQWADSPFTKMEPPEKTATKGETASTNRLR